MTVEYLPVGIKCNLKCTYCYQEPMREAGNFSAPLDFVKVKATLEKANQDFALFGGEPLLAPVSHLEEVWQYGFEKHGHNGIQTNGLLITDVHLKLFKKYNVQVGISIDGPPSINSVRCNKDDTLKILWNIERTLGFANVSLIVTVHKLSSMYLGELLDFLRRIEALGIQDVNLHNLEVDNCATDEALKLSDIENLEVFRAIYDRYKDSNLRLNPFQDIRKLLTHPNPSVSCIWTNCDPVTTPAVHGINAQGDLVNCGRVNKDGVDYLKSNSARSLERYQALALTAQEDGGCKGCSYFFVCKGQCPGTAIDGDWRNRTKDCLFWYMLIDYIRRDLDATGTKLISLDDGNKAFLSSINTDRPGEHGDSPHGDSHEDFTDVTERGREGRRKSTNRVRPC